MSIETKLSPIEALSAILNSPLVGAECVAFPRGSDAHRAAETAGLEIEEVEQHVEDVEQADLFAPPPAERAETLRVDLQWIFGKMPFDYGGERVADACDAEEDPGDDGVGVALAWDERQVLAACPRGYCLLNRSEWQDGYRFCRGC